MREDRLPNMTSSPRVGPPRPHIIETEIDDEVSLYNAQNERVMVLNITASDVWRLCDGEQTLDEIVDLIAKAYRVDRERINSEVALTIGRFVEADFLPPLHEGNEGPT